jgi:hypothetical protein|tara:strand:- start:9680 stop:10579 length:900 start_codon:yes stop_codon:yes gene_type:complete
MTNKIKIVDQDIIFLSYDEPNAEKNYSDLCSKVPWAKRVHGVKGSDAAHKACAALSETEYFITVDADNIVDPEFLNQEVDVDALGLTPEHVFSWCGKVHVNGLMYGNGGLKMWTRKFVHNMKTHENSDVNDERGKVEFCFDDKYYQFNDSFSTSYTNASPWQAWRAGFREGVKMSLDQGAKVLDLRSVWWQNYDRLLVWSQIGADVNNGIWSILGARQGCYMTNCTDWDYANVRDFEWLNNFWESDVKHLNAEDESIRLGLEILKGTGVDISTKPLDAEQSKFFKQVYNNSPRILRRAK